VKKAVSEREKRQAERKRHTGEVARLMGRYDREALCEQVWSAPVQDVPKSYGILRAPLVHRPAAL